jgi:hypothetical protein
VGNEALGGSKRCSESGEPSAELPVPLCGGKDRKGLPHFDQLAGTARGLPESVRAAGAARSPARAGAGLACGGGKGRGPGAQVPHLARPQPAPARWAHSRCSGRTTRSRTARATRPSYWPWPRARCRCPASTRRPRPRGTAARRRPPPAPPAPQPAAPAAERPEAGAGVALGFPGCAQPPRPPPCWECRRRADLSPWQPPSRGRARRPRPHALGPAHVRSAPPPCARPALMTLAPPPRAGLRPGPGLPDSASENGRGWARCEFQMHSESGFGFVLFY